MEEGEGWGWGGGLRVPHRWEGRLTSVVSEPVAPALVMSENVCCPLGCFLTRSSGTEA